MTTAQSHSVDSPSIGRPMSAKQIAHYAALRAAKEAKLMASAIKRLTGPLQVGDRAICGYWRKSYTLIAINLPRPGFSSPSITVRWDADRSQGEHEGTHATHWDNYRDVALTGENTNASVTDYQALIMAKRTAALKAERQFPFSQAEI